MAQVAEARLHEDLRRAHCDHSNNNDPAHQCVGTTTISPKGTFLSCTLCGKCPLDEKLQNPLDAHKHLTKLSRSLGRAHLRLIGTTDALEDAVAQGRWFYGR